MGVVRRVIKTLFELMLGVPTKLRVAPVTGLFGTLEPAVGVIGAFLVQVEGWPEQVHPDWVLQLRQP